MDSSFDIPDPSDWFGTPVHQLASVESALRCRICKDFFNTPMITSCSHTFCSLCIRRCLTSDGQCPACRAPDQEMRLRPNSTVQELVDAFQESRPSVLQLASDFKTRKENANPGKRKRPLDDLGDEPDVDGFERLPLRKTRSRSARNGLTASDPSQTIDNTTDEDFEPSPTKKNSRARKSPASTIDDGLSACPICNERMKEEEVFLHLDIHNDPPTSKLKPSKLRGSMIGQPKPMERLPQLNYSLLKDIALRKKLTELGIPSHGPKTLLIKRHTEWVNIVNANCDSRLQRSKRELLQDLDIWDRTQGRQILNGTLGSPSSVMSKDFDSTAWKSDHSTNFRDLIAQARQKAASKQHSGESDNVETKASKEEMNPTSHVTSIVQESRGSQNGQLHNGIDDN